jgi:hypothetical protein|tara:strand:- start:264 stop:428 length:165 start_codon:yes stop_codon:yes gene_type:complete
LDGEQQLRRIEILGLYLTTREPVGHASCSNIAFVGCRFLLAIFGRGLLFAQLMP